VTATINTGWYELFSRGARDWLRHNDKVREAVQNHLPDLIAGPDLITGPQERTVQVPVRLLEHARFKLADGRSQTGAGQGVGEPGDILQTGQPERQPGAGDSGEGGSEDGEVRLLLEFSIDDVMDWVWEELKLPDLKPKPSTRIDDVELVREGWDKRGARSRLDRRRTVKEAIKRRAVQVDPVPFTNDDLRFRQLVTRPRPSTSAVIFFVIDVSASMTQIERKLAKSFFFFALQGIRRKYAKVEARFIAHTTHAWEFSENEFFQVSGIGGTIASSAFRLALELVNTQLNPAQNNIYMFYASDGENFTEDRTAASQSLSELGGMLNYIGYIETLPGVARSLETEMRRLCNELERRGLPIGSSVLASTDDVWRALRKFFTQESEAADAEVFP
jgi:sporulation protein YhbH